MEPAIKHGGFPFRTTPTGLHNCASKAGNSEQRNGADSHFRPKNLVAISDMGPKGDIGPCPVECLLGNRGVADINLARFRRVTLWLQFLELPPVLFRSSGYIRVHEVEKIRLFEKHGRMRIPAYRNALN
jgi:hypothetical protein